MKGRQGYFSGDGKPCSCGKADCPICRVFGCANKGESKESDESSRGSMRIIARDAFLTEEWSKSFTDGKPIVEEKSENSLNRITAEANPRPVERVVPGVKFDFEIDCRVIDTGGGSRGNGQIAFAELKDENGNEISL